MARTLETRAAPSLKGALLKSVLCALAIAGPSAGLAAEAEPRHGLTESDTVADSSAVARAEGNLSRFGEPEAAGGAPEETVCQPASFDLSEHSPSLPLLLAVYEVAPIDAPVVRPPVLPPPGGPQPPIPLCVAGGPKLIRDTRISGMLGKFNQFMAAAKSGQGAVVTIVALGTPMDWKPYGAIRPMGKQEDFEVPCCLRPNAPAPTIFPVTKFTGNVVGEMGLLGQKRVGLSMILSTLPQTKFIENVSGIGQKIDDYFAKFGAGCMLRAFGEFSVTGGGSYYDGSAPCLKCSTSVHLSATVLGGGGVQCTAGGAPSLPQTHLIQGSIQAWGKISPIGYQEDCFKGQLLKPGLSACIQFRIRYYDWLDIERQYCSESWSPF